MTLDWNWSELLSGIAGVVIGWLMKLLHLNHVESMRRKKGL